MILFFPGWPGACRAVIGTRSHIGFRLPGSKGVPEVRFERFRKFPEGFAAGSVVRQRINALLGIPPEVNFFVR